MIIRFLDKSGNDNLTGTGRKRSPHYDNLDYLDNNPALKAAMSNALNQHFDNFFYVRTYMNSGGVSVAVCNIISIPDDQFHHGLVGSLIYDTFLKIDPTNYGLNSDTEVIASKGDNQHYVDYFIPANHH